MCHIVTQKFIRVHNNNNNTFTYIYTILRAVLRAMKYIEYAQLAILSRQLNSLYSIV